MPELPEVESLRLMLTASVAGRTIVSAAIRERRLRRRVAADFCRAVAGRRIGLLRRRAKYLIIELSGEMALLVHLGMSGSLTHRGSGFSDEEFDPAHDHLHLRLDDGTALVYNDPRRFGLLRLVPSAEIDASAELSNLGPEPLSPDFNAEYLWNKARGRRVAIKNLIMDQRVVAGIGNIYACEILFRAKVRPTRRAGKVSRAELQRIAQATPIILKEAIGSGGTTFRSYRDSRGRPGEFAPSLQVYGREGERCYVCGVPIRNRVVGQRASFYCPTCQR